MRFYLIRHGEMAGDPFVRPSRPVSGSLSERGVTQAKRLRNTLAEARIDHVFTSSYGRAIQTAEIALAGRDIPFDILECLIEWQPNPKLKAVSTEHEKILRMNEERYAEETWKTELGEGTFDLYARVCPGFLKAIERLGLHPRMGGLIPDPGKEDLCLAVFAHGGSLGVLLSFLLELRPFPISRFSFQLTGMARVDFSERQGIFYPQLVVAT